MRELNDTDYERVVLSIEGEAGPHIGSIKFTSVLGESFVHLNDFRDLDYLINTRYVKSIRFLSVIEYKMMVARYRDFERSVREP